MLSRTPEAVKGFDSQLLGTVNTVHRLQLSVQLPSPRFNSVRLGVVRDPQRSLTLRQGIAVLLEKKAIEEVQNSDQQREFYSIYFLLP